MIGQLDRIIDRHRPAWWADAACRSAHAQDLIARGKADFFPERGRSAGVARDICAACPVRVDCLDSALDDGRWLHGIRGGLTQAQRRRLLDQTTTTERSTA